MSVLLKFNLALEEEDLKIDDTEVDVEAETDPAEDTDTEVKVDVDVEVEVEGGEGTEESEELEETEKEAIEESNSESSDLPVIDEEVTEEHIETLENIGDGLAETVDSGEDVSEVTLESIKFSLSLISQLYGIDTSRPRNVLAIENFQGGTLSKARNAEIAAKLIKETVQQLKK